MNVPMLKKDATGQETGLEEAQNKVVQLSRSGATNHGMSNGSPIPVLRNAAKFSGSPSGTAISVPQSGTTVPVPRNSFFKGCLIGCAVGACIWAGLIYLLIL